MFPRGNANHDRVFAATYSLNGNGEMTGVLWVEESGHLGTPVLITNTHSVGVVRDAVVEWSLRHGIREGYNGDFTVCRSSARRGTASSTTSAAFT